MLPTLVIALGFAAMVVAGFVAVIVLRGAFGVDKETSASSLLEWRPSFIEGDALRNWAAYRAEELTRSELASNHRADTAIRLITQLEAAAGHAMLPLARPAELERVIACPAQGQGLVSVNAPEAITLAERLRRQKSKRELQRIQEMTAANALRLAAEPGGDGLPPMRCPLQGADHICCIYAARPLHCRPLHATTIAHEMGNRSVHFGEPRADAKPAAASHEQTVAQGIELGLSRALKSAGLDATTYEMNSALARALEVPDAAERWAKGENIFAGCHVVRG